MINEIKHPLIEHKLPIRRDKRTGTKEFRELASEIATILCYEAMKDAKLEEVEIETPLQKIKTGKIDENKYAFVPILRAGMGMTEGIENLIPNAKIGVVGLYRNEETLKPVKYYYKTPKDIDTREVIILDPMLATGGSDVKAIDIMKEKGAKVIKMICLVGVDEGINAVTKAHPDVDIYLASKDEKLNENAYIVPGLGDAGDRLFGTK